MGGKGKTLDDYKTLAGVDWQDQLFRSAGMQQHNISLSGGSDKTIYYLSGSLDNQPGVIINSGFNRYQGKLTLTQNVTDKLKLYVNSNYSKYTSDGIVPSAGGGSATDNLLYSTWGYRPISGSGYDLTEDLFDPDVDGANDYRINPVISARNELRRSTTNSLNVNSYAQYNFNKNLFLKITGGITSSQRRNDRFNNSLTRYGNPVTQGGVKGVNGSVIYNEVDRWLNENTINYKKTFNKVHEFGAVAGVTFQRYDAATYGSSAIQVPNESLGLNGLDEGVPEAIQASSSYSTLNSYLARVNYGYKSKYLLTASIRADGSSKFAKGNRWSYFPSASFAWRMSSENFMKDLIFINDAKLRIGYGVTGNNRVGDFDYLPVMGQPTGSPYAFNNSINIGAVPLDIGNPNLKWESTAQTNIGYDLGLFKDRVSITADVYRKTTYDLLLNADLPATTGYVSVFKNIGKVRNQGLELSINTINVKNKNFSWSTNFNISFNRSKVLELNGEQQYLTSGVSWEKTFNGAPLYRTQVGQPISQFYTYTFDGIYQISDFDVDGAGAYTLKAGIPDNGASVQPGDPKFKDFAGPNSSTPDGTITSADMKFVGRTEPLHIGGFTNNFTYKNFDLNIFFQWSYGNQIYNANRMVFEGNILRKTNLNQYASFANRWTPTNPSNTINRVGGEGPSIYSTRFLEDGSFLRLKTVSLGYNFDSKVLKKLKISSLKIFASGQNLLTFTKYTGMDPEVSVRSNSALTPGFDYSAYPRARTIVFGLSTSL